MSEPTKTTPETAMLDAVARAILGDPESPRDDGQGAARRAIRAIMAHLAETERADHPLGRHARCYSTLHRIAEPAHAE